MRLDRRITPAPAVFAAGVVSLVFAYLNWLMGIEAPVEIVGGTASAVGIVAGWAFPE